MSRSEFEVTQSRGLKAQGRFIRERRKVSKSLTTTRLRVMQVNALTCGIVCCAGMFVVRVCGCGQALTSVAFAIALKYNRYAKLMSCQLDCATVIPKLAMTVRWWNESGEGCSINTQGWLHAAGAGHGKLY